MYRPVRLSAGLGVWWRSATGLVRHRIVAPCANVLWKVVRDAVPRSCRTNIRMKLRSDTRVIIEGTHTNRDLTSLWPFATEETGTANRTERLDCPLARTVD